jgi:hypothetical protein
MIGFNMKKKNSNQNSVVLVKFILVYFMISLNYTPDWLQTFNLFNFAFEEL